MFLEDNAGHMTRTGTASDSAKCRRGNLDISLLWIKLAVMIKCHHVACNGNVVSGYPFHQLATVVAELFHAHLLPRRDDGEIFCLFQFDRITILITHNITCPFKFIQMFFQLMQDQSGFFYFFF